MTDHDSSHTPDERPNTDRPEPKTAFGRWLRRFENPTVGDLIIVVGLIPVIALLALVIFAWVFGGD